MEKIFTSPFGLIPLEARYSEHPKTKVESRADRYFNDALFPEELDQLGTANILFLGCGNVGSNLAFEMVKRGIGTEGKIVLVDPDSIERHNITSGQVYSNSQIGEPKSSALAKNLAPLLRTNSTVQVLTRALDPDELRTICEENQIGLIVEAIDISEPQAVLDAHRIALELKIPTITGLDIMTGGTVVTYNYSAGLTTPLNGELTEKTVARYNELMSTAVTDEEKKRIVYWALTHGIIGRDDLVPTMIINILGEAIRPTSKVTQLPQTARSLGALGSIEASKLLLNKNPHLTSRSRFDLDSEQHPYGLTNMIPFKQVVTEIFGRLIFHQIHKTYSI